MKKSARFLLLGVGLAAAGGVYMLMNQSKPSQPVIVQAAPTATKVDSDQVLVATKDIGLGTLLSDIDVQWADWPKAHVSEGIIRKSDTPKALEEINGAVTRAPFLRGEPIRQAKVVKSSNAGFLSAILPSGSRAVAISIDRSGGSTAGGFILPNDRVDIIRISRARRQQLALPSETILRNVTGSRHRPAGRRKERRTCRCRFERNPRTDARPGRENCPRAAYRPALTHFAQHAGCLYPTMMTRMKTTHGHDHCPLRQPSSTAIEI